eukprot:bmy_14074T0
MKSYSSGSHGNGCPAESGWVQGEWPSRAVKSGVRLSREGPVPSQQLPACPLGGAVQADPDQAAASGSAAPARPHSEPRGGPQSREPSRERPEGRGLRAALSEPRPSPRAPGPRSGPRRERAGEEAPASPGMEGMEAAARPAGGSLQGPKIGSRTASSMEVTSAVEGSGPEPQPENGHLPRHWPCPREDRTPSLMAPQPPGAQGIQLQGPSVLESKVRALKEKMTAGKQGASPCLTSHERPSLKKPKCRRVKVGGTRTPSEGSSLPDAVVVHHAQNPNDGLLDSSVTEEESARNGAPGPPRLPASGLQSWNRRSPWPPEAVRTLPDHDRALPPGPSSLQESPMHRVTPSQPEGSGPCNKTTHRPSLRKGRSYPLQDGLVSQEDLDSLSLTSEEDFVPRPALLGELWRAGDLGALGTGGSTLSLSDRVERNRLLLQEMLSVGGQGPSKVGSPAWTSSRDRAVPERPAGDVDWDSGISLQDADQSR